MDGSLKVADPYAEKILDPNNDRFIPAVTYPNLKVDFIQFRRFLIHGVRIPNVVNIFIPWRINQIINNLLITINTCKILLNFIFLLNSN